MANKTKHAQRSKRSYRQQQANISAYAATSMQKQATKALIREKREGVLSRLVNHFARNRESKKGE